MWVLKPPNLIINSEYNGSFTDTGVTLSASNMVPVNGKNCFWSVGSGGLSLADYDTNSFYFKATLTLKNPVHHTYETQPTMAWIDSDNVTHNHLDAKEMPFGVGVQWIWEQNFTHVRHIDIHAQPSIQQWVSARVIVVGTIGV